MVGRIHRRLFSVPHSTVWVLQWGESPSWRLRWRKHPRKLRSPWWLWLVEMLREWDGSHHWPSSSSDRGSWSRPSHRCVEKFWSNPTWLLSGRSNGGILSHTLTSWPENYSKLHWLCLLQYQYNCLALWGPRSKWLYTLLKFPRGVQSPPEMISSDIWHHFNWCRADLLMILEDYLQLEN